MLAVNWYFRLIQLPLNLVRTAVTDSPQGAHAMFLKIRIASALIIVVSAVPLTGRTAPPPKDKKPKGFVVAELKPDAPDWVRDFFRESEARRLRLIQLKQAELEIAKRNTRRASARKAEKENAKEQVKTIEADLETLLANPVQVSTFEGVTVGESNNFLKAKQVLKFGETVHVQQVIGKQRALLIVNEEYVTQGASRGTIVTDQKTRRTPVLLNGVSTENWTDGSKQTVNEILLVAGTETFPNAIGSSNTVFVLEPVDLAQYIDTK